MIHLTARRRFALASVLAPAVLTACGKEKAAPPATPPPAPATTAPVATTTTTTTLPPPPLVWRLVRWGMTKDEVLAAFPGEAQKLPAPVEFGPKVTGTTDVTIPAYETDGMTFRVMFGFDSGVLDRVHLSAVKPGPAACGDLEKLLTDKHSAPSDRSRMQTNIRSEEILWKLPDQTITLFCSESAGLGYRSVMLDHRPPSQI